MSYILQRTESFGNGHSCYVALSGSKNSYTSNKYIAQRFETKEDAENSACGNEFPVKVEL